MNKLNCKNCKKPMIFQGSDFWYCKICKKTFKTKITKNGIEVKEYFIKRKLLMEMLFKLDSPKKHYLSKLVHEMKGYSNIKENLEHIKHLNLIKKAESPNRRERYIQLTEKGKEVVILFKRMQEILK